MTFKEHLLSWMNNKEIEDLISALSEDKSKHAVLLNIKKISEGTLIAGMATMVYLISAFVGISIPVATYQLFLFFGILVGWFKNRDDIIMSEEALKALETKEEVASIQTA